MKTALEMKLYWWSTSNLSNAKIREMKRYCRKAYKKLKVYGYVECHLDNSKEREYVQKFFEALEYKVNNNSSKDELFISF